MAKVETFKRLLAVLGLAWVGLVAGFAYWLPRIPQGSGLAGPAIALGYGAGGLLLGLLVGGLLAARLRPERLGSLLKIVALLSFLALAATIGRIVWAQGERDAKRATEQALAAAPFEVSGQILNPADGSDFLSITVDGHSDRFELTPRRDDLGSCRGAITAKERSRLLRSVREAEAYTDQHPGACGAGQAGAELVLRQFSWRLPEASDEQRAVDITSSCAQQHEQLAALYSKLQGVSFRVVRTDKAIHCGPPD